MVVKVVVVVSWRRRSATHWRLTLHRRSIRRSSTSSATVPSWWWRSSHASSWTIASSSWATVLPASWWTSTTPHWTSSSARSTVHHGESVVWHGWNRVAVLVHWLSTTRGATVWWVHVLRAISSTANRLKRRVALVQRLHVVVGRWLGGIKVGRIAACHAASHCLTRKRRR